MIRPTFNRFAEGDPREDFNSRMRTYLLHLEENQQTLTYQDLLRERNEAWIDGWRKEEKIRDLRRTLKTMRSQIKTIYKEHHGYEKATMHSLQDSYDSSKS